MPDLFSVLEKRWKFIFGFTMLAAVVAFVVTLFSPKEYLATATALPANSMIADKARIYNQNIEALYSDIGTPDELDRLEGTAMVDTIYIDAVDKLGLVQHYEAGDGGDAFYKAAMELRKNSKISRSAYGELKVKVWDRNQHKAAEIANTLMKSIQDVHQRLQNENNMAILETLRKDRDHKTSEFLQASDTAQQLSGARAEIWNARKEVLLEQLQQYEKMIDQYQLAVNTNPRVLLMVEHARTPVWHDKPKTLVTVLLSAFAAFALAFLVALFVQSRNTR